MDNEMVLSVKFRLTREQYCTLWRKAPIFAFSRRIPTKAWTEAEMKEAVRYTITKLVMKGVM